MGSALTQPSCASRFSEHSGLLRTNSFAGDEISVVTSAEGSLVGTGITKDAGNHTFRAWMREDAGGDAFRSQELDEVFETFASAASWHSWSCR